ncbi:MAG: hypothetical protein JO359_14745, partial [Candidatus Eremiobacteraeota bacterium]|nr:hypothetical protein [Candidatus Eremiobacteraeota bacterium]
VLAAAASFASIPAQAQQTSPPPAVSATAAATSPAAASHAVAPPRTVRHLVYRFGYNTKAHASGDGTGTTTLDYVGPASDGGFLLKMTDDWWMSAKPRQSYTCEVYPSGGVSCNQAPFAMSPIQAVIVPLLGKNYFSALSAGPTATWKQSYTVRATFTPGGNQGFLGQVRNWLCAYNLTGKGTVMNNGQPLDSVYAEGTMNQQGSRDVTVNQKANILVDPRLQIPVYVDELVTFGPRMGINKYTVETKLIRVQH